MQLTSLRCYQEIKRNGLLSRMRLAALEILTEFGPGTAGEISQRSQEVGLSQMSKADLSTRLSELRHLGVARQGDDLRKCAVSGHECLVWEVVDALPRKPDPDGRQTCRQQLIELRERYDGLSTRHLLLQARCQGLEQRLQQKGIREVPQLSLFEPPTAPPPR